MKKFKMLGLAVFATAAITSLLGAATASAETTELFSGVSTLSSGQVITASLASGTSATLVDTSEGLVDTCKGSTVSYKTTNTTGPQVNGSISTLDWTNCTFTTTTLVGGGLAFTKRAGTNDATVSGSGTEVTVLAFGFIDCIYGTGSGGTHLGTLDGVSSGNAVVDINATINLQTDEFGCPETTKWIATYTVTSPTALNVGS